jgi:hypothetical protein
MNGNRASATAVAALFISIASFSVSSFQACQTRTAQRLAVKPRLHLDFRRSTNPNPFAGIWLLNVGVGPAEPKALTVSLDGIEQRSWKKVLASIGAEQSGELDYSVLRAGTFYRPGYEGLLIKVTGASAQSTFASAFGRMVVTACYCSLYDQCWRVRLPEYTTIDEPNGCPAPQHEMDE